MARDGKVTAPIRVATRRTNGKVLWTAWRGPKNSRIHYEALRSGRERPGVTLRVASSEAEVRRVVAAATGLEDGAPAEAVHPTSTERVDLFLGNSGV